MEFRASLPFEGLDWSIIRLEDKMKKCDDVDDDDGVDGHDRSELGSSEY
jgi:hypothetical protein